MRTRIVVRWMLLTMSLLIVVTTASGALAHHEQGHHCRANPHLHEREFYKQRAEEDDAPRGQVRKQHVHHDHDCASPYPPNPPRTNARGASASLAVAVPEPGGLTVGAASLMSLGALAVTLVARRRWVFSTGRRP